MLFADILRNSRSSPATVLHKFLLNYDPTAERVHAFVEGAPDLAFYRYFIERYADASLVRMYNCGGKRQVYDTYAKVATRFPHCMRVIFLVDKDLDDIAGQSWPSDPRIYVTEVYSIENFLVSRAVVERYLSDFVKIRKVTFDFSLALQRFDDQLKTFQKAVLPMMGWILTARRAGKQPTLSNIEVGQFISVSDSGIRRKRNSGRLEYLAKVSELDLAPGVLRQVRRNCGELRRLEAKRYIRGKFEGWFLVQFIRRLVEALSAVARQSGGSISVVIPLEDSNYVQLLASCLSIPTSLATFLTFHLRAHQKQSSAEAPGLRQGWLVTFLKQLFN